MSLLKKHRFGIYSLLVFILFFRLIPVDFYNLLPVIISIIGAAVLTLFLVLYFFKFKTFKELKVILTDKSKLNKRSFIGESFFIAICLIFFSMLFILDQSENEEKELVKNGVVTKAEIIDKSKFSVVRRLRKHTVYNFSLRFKDETENIKEVAEQVSPDIYNDFSKGETVRIIYSRENPNIVEIK